MTKLELYPFQESGVQFLTNGFHRLLADDMGLGKTVQVIEAANRLQARKMVIVCPASVKIQWAREILKWSKFKHTIHICKGRRNTIPFTATVIIVNYDLLVGDRMKNQLQERTQGFDIAVMDEAHYMKEMKSKRTKAVLGAKSFLRNCRYRWALTGTPVLNRPAEIYPLLFTLAHERLEPYTTWQDYAMRYCRAYQERQCRRCGKLALPDHKECENCKCTSFTPLGMNTKGASNLDELAEKLDGFMLRRKKEDVLHELPDKVETIVELDGVDPELTMENAHIATARQALSIAKVPRAVRYVEDLLQEVDKLVIFAHHTEAIFALMTKLKDYQPVIIKGGMDAEKKQKSVDLFVNNPYCRIVIAQTMAGGTGIDGLQLKCSNVVFLDPDWSPGIMDQATDRLRRIGQKDTVFVYYMVVPGSMDDHMQDKLDQKRQVIKKLVKSKEVIIMALEQVLERIAIALEKMSGDFTPGNTDDSGEKKPSARKAPAKKAEVKETPAASASNKTQDDIRKAATAFVNVTPNVAENKKIVMEQLLPKYGAKTISELDASDYDAFLDDLAKGPQAYGPVGGDPLADM